MFEVLRGEMIDLWLRWNVFQQLFPKDRAQVDLLNKVAPSFFGFVQKLLLDSILLGISRLGDPAKMGKNQNLSLAQLVDSLGLECAENVREDVGEHVEKFELASEKVRIHRSKRLAHTDLDHAVGPDELPAVSMRDIKKCLDELESVMNLVQTFLRHDPDNPEAVHRTAYELSNFSAGGVDALLERLKR